MNPPRIILIQVKDAHTKLLELTKTAELHFEKKEPMIFFVEDDKALSFLDELLWKFPQISFLPHVTTESPIQEYLVITKIKKNLNQAKIAFNLCPTPLLIDGGFKIVYDFEDLSSPSKKNFSQMRYSAYRNANYFIEAR